jgi:hypothetical protein
MVIITLGIRNYNSIRGLRRFLIYAFFSGAQCVAGSIINAYRPLNLYRSLFFELSINFFVIFEFIVFCSFLINVIRDSTAKFLLKLVGAFYILLTLYSWVFLKALYSFPEKLNLMEALFILVPCLYYYYEILKHSTSRPLYQDPIFWIVTGIFFFFVTITPFFLLDKSVNQYFHFLYEHIYSINYLSYIILYSCFTNALLCKIKLMRS